MITANGLKNMTDTLTIKDKIGRTLKVDLDKAEFIVQRKAIPVIQPIESIKDKKIVKQKIKEFVDLVKGRFNKNFSEIGAGFTKNFGFIDGKAVWVDTVSLMQGICLHAEESPILKRKNKTLRLWLRENGSEDLLQDYDNNVDNLLKEKIF